jgi:Na+/H+-dicarboxylate symporter
MDILPVILFSLVFGAVLTTIGEKGKPVIDFFAGAEQVIMKMVGLIILFAPLGVFGLIAGRFAQAGDLGAVIAGLSKYMGTVLLGLSFHGFVVLPLIFWFITRRNPYRYLLAMQSALLTAFSTASSSATLPEPPSTKQSRSSSSPKPSAWN